jgi:D-sedoheptulose 7-phosphate isomerase
VIEIETMMRAFIEHALQESLAVKRQAVSAQLDRIIRSARRMADCLRGGRKLLIFGNGGSAADAQHMAAEFVNRFRIERPPLAAIALTTDTSVLTSIGNDDSFEAIFTKQIIALGQKGDIAWGWSTSGNSANVIRALEKAREMNLFCIGMTGRGGRLVEHVDIALHVESDVTARIQETHITLGHILCELVERILYDEQPATME